MTKTEFLSLLNNPQSINKEIENDLREMISNYPFFPHPHLLMATTMSGQKDMNAAYYVNKAAAYATDKKSLYFLLNPEYAQLEPPQKVERDNNSTGNYFEMLEKVESKGGDTKLSLKSLADKLKSAREAIQTKTEQPAKPLKTPTTGNLPKINIPTPDYFSEQEYQRSDINVHREEQVKILIRERKYEEALEILKQLNLNNPKKSIYFADQIRFLEKILVNTKKTT